MGYGEGFRWVVAIHQVSLEEGKAGAHGPLEALKNEDDGSASAGLQMRSDTCVSCCLAKMFRLH